jgi:hypothetical protein
VEDEVVISLAPWPTDSLPPPMMYRHEADNTGGPSP